MAFEEFQARVADAKALNPFWFELAGDRPATDEEITESERLLGAMLPEDYRRFLKAYGGGYFAFANVFSVQPGSEWNLVEQNRRRKHVVSGFVAISDNYSGDVYGMQSVNGVCQPQIWFHDHETGEWSRSPYDSVLSYLDRMALRRS